VSRNPESILSDAIRLALSADGRSVMWRNSTGLATINGHKIRYGLAVGSGDFVGFLTNEAGPRTGAYLELEIKTPRGVSSKDQLMRADLVRRMGGFYAVVRSVEDAIAAIDRAAQGARE
jgi:hypothetical protein